MKSVSSRDRRSATTTSTVLASFSSRLPIMSSSLLLLLLTLVVSSANGKCRWYGNCGVPPGAKLNIPVPCTYSGEAKPLTDPAGLDILSELCYGIFPTTTTTKDPPKLCCDTSQLVALRTNFQIASTLLRRCPACLANFHRYFCYQTCSPDQAEFMAITDYSGIDPFIHL